MQFEISGKIDHSEFYNGANMIYLATPAPDAYSQPGGFKVRSQQPLGAVGQEVRLLVSVRGFIRNKQYTCKHTNQPKVYREDNVFLDVVQSLPMQSEQPTRVQQAVASKQRAAS